MAMVSPNAAPPPPRDSGQLAGQFAGLPAGSCDCHFHVFDATRYPYAAHRHYTPSDATLASYLALCAQAGIDRSVLVHPTVYGADHRSFEALLTQHADRLRGVAVVAPDTPERDIARWHAMGVRGTRITTIFAGPDMALIRSIVERVRPFGWHVQLLVDVVAHPELVVQVCALGVTVVVDHLGHHAAAQLPDSAGFANLLGLMCDEAAWVKLSAPYRLSADGCHDASVQRVVAALVGANPRRLVWGTDWPHPASPHPVPADAQLLAQVLRWLPDAPLRQSVLVDNPTRLYWLDAPAP